MKIIKKMLYGLLGILSLVSLFIIICAFDPTLSDHMADLIYGKEKPVEKDIVSVPEMEIHTVTDTDTTEIPDKEAEYISPAREGIAVPEEVSGKGGYRPVEEENIQVDEAEAEKLREKYTYGETGDDLSFDTEYYPYYGMLDEKMQKLYRQIYANANAVNGIFNPIEAASPSQLRNVFMAVFHDHPELFWLNSAYRGRFDQNGSCVEIVLDFNELIDNLEAAKAAFQKSAEEILTNAGALGSDHEREVYVHDALLDKIEYDLGAPLNQSAYSALVNGRTVCAGYARAFQYLLMQLQIPCYYCAGYAGESHAWNIVKLDGDFYNVDTTWDDTNPNTYNYFNKTDDDFAKTHMREDLSVYLPRCNGTAYGNLESNPAEEVYYTEDMDSEKRSLSDTGFSEEDVLRSMEDYYQDCYERTMENGGSGQFDNVVDNEAIWLSCYQAYTDDSYSAAYMNQVLDALGASGCEVNIEAEPLKDGRVLLHHNFTFF